MAGSSHERILAAEMLVVMGVETADALSGASSGSFTLPDPSRYFATLIAYGVLAGVAMFGEKAGKLASALGGVAALAILMAPAKSTGKPLVLSVITYFDQIITGGTQGPPGSSGAGATIGTPAEAGQVDRVLGGQGVPQPTGTPAQASAIDKILGGSGTP
jgi:hypothetical protein